MNKETQYWNKVCKRLNLSGYTKAECNKRSKQRSTSSWNKVINPRPVLKSPTTSSFKKVVAEAQYWNKVCKRLNLSGYTKAECNKRSKPPVISNMKHVNNSRLNPFQKLVLKSLAEKRAGNTRKNVSYEPNGRGGWKQVSASVNPPRFSNTVKQMQLAGKSAQAWKKASGLNNSTMKCKCKTNGNKKHLCMCNVPNNPLIHKRYIPTIIS
jgi:hypothetical protein